MKSNESVNIRRLYGLDRFLLIKLSVSFIIGSLAMILMFGTLAGMSMDENDRSLSKEPRSIILGEHPNQADCVFSPDGKTVVSFGQGRSVKNKYGIPQPLGAMRIWEVVSRKSRLFEWKEGIGTVAFSPDGNLLAITTGEKVDEDRRAGGLTGDPIIVLWRVKTEKQLAVMKWNPKELVGLGPVVFSPDGRMLAAGTKREFFTRRCRVPLWEVPSGKLRHALEVGKECFVYTVQFSPNGKTVAIGGLMSDPERRMSIHDEPSILQLWDVDKGRVQAEYKELKGPIYSIVFSPDGKLLAVGGNIGQQINEILIWDLVKKERHAVLTGHRGVVHQVAFSHDGKLLASAGGSERDGELRLWDVKKLREVASLKGHTNAVTSISFSPDDSMLASGSRDSTVRLWYLREPAKDKGDR